MKKFLALTLCILIAFSCACAPAFAENVPADVTDEPVKKNLVVGSTTQLSGCFFTEMWGNNTSDADVRGLLHDYQTIAWTSEASYAINETAVESMTADDLGNGNRVYTIKVNENLVYCDGTPITAKDYVFSVLLQSSAAIAQLGGSATGMSHILGHDDYLTGRSAVFSGVRLLDAYTFSLTIPGEYLPYFYELTLVNVTPYPMGVIAPGCDIQDDGEGAYIAGAYTAELLRGTILGENGYLARPMVTSGAYKLVSYDAAAHVAEFEINPYYVGNYEGQLPSIQYLTFKHVSNTDMLDEMRAGTVDLLNKVSSGAVIDEAVELALNEEARTISYLRPGFAFLAFSCENPVVSDARVRQALAYCVDTTALCTEFLRGYGLPVYSYYGYGQWMTANRINELEALNLYQYDLNSASYLLQEAGWSNNSVHYHYNAGDGVRYMDYTPLIIRFARPENSTAADLVEAQLRDAAEQVGIQLEVTQMPMDELLRYYYRQQDRSGYDMFFMATNFTHVFDPYNDFNTGDAYQGVYNKTGLKDAHLMELADAMRHVEAGDTESYLEHWMAFLTYWQQCMPMVPLYSNAYYDVFIPTLNDYFANAHWSWSAAILYASIGEETVEEVIEPEGEGTPEGTVEFTW